MFNWKWYLKDLKPPDKNIKVFSMFSCGGGSSMGYKRAGFDVIGNLELDPKINKIYIKNLNPKFNFNMDIRDFNKLDNLPAELYNLDILDGSPPCTPFSMVGNREEGWNKYKKFQEGQKLQRLDDLFFVFLDTIEKLRPKIIIAENVTGIIKGNAKGYVNEIIHRFHQLGYNLQMFQLNAALMDVPQVRERVFFIANNQHYPKLKLDFHGDLIPFGKVRTKDGKPLIKKITAKRLEFLLPTDMCIGDIVKRTENKENNFSNMIYWDNRVAFTIVSSGIHIRANDKKRLSVGDFINCSSFPQDYDFCNKQAQFICGMCVPPNMMANLAIEIYNQWLN